MIRVILFLLLSITTVYGQLRVLPGVAGKTVSAVTPPTESNIQDIDITVRPDQYQDNSVSITADANGASVNAWSWRIIHRTPEADGSFDTTMVATSTVQNPTFVGSITEPGFYDVKLTARSGNDKYVVYEQRYFQVFRPRFDEGEADIVIDMSVGSGVKYYDYHLTDMSDMKVYLKGSNANTACLEFRDWHATEGHPVQIQKSNDNNIVEFGFVGGTGKVWNFSQYGAGEGARYIVVNGFNTDGTPGIKVNGPTGTSITVNVVGKLTDVGFYGITVAGSPLTVDGAGIAIVPTVGATCRKDNWTTNNLHVWYCTITAGEEGVYFGESSQSTGYIGNNGQNPPSGIGAIVSRNTILGSGRDGLQVGCMGGEGRDNVIIAPGQQREAAHEACVCSNDGSFMIWEANHCFGGEMFASIKSGEYNWSPLAGHTGPQPTILRGNVFSSGDYVPDPNPDNNEPFAIYVQNNPNSGAGSWQVIIENNTVYSFNKSCEFLLALGGFASNNFTFANNIIIKTGAAGDSQALNFTGNGKATLQTGTKTENNLVRNTGSDLSDLYFTDYTSGDFSITSTSSAAYAGSPTNTSLNTFDYLGFPNPVPVSGYYFGAFSSYNLRTIAP